MNWMLWLVEALAVATFARHLGLGWWIWLVFAFALAMEIYYLGVLREFLLRKNLTLTLPAESVPPVRSIQ